MMIRRQRCILKCLHHGWHECAILWSTGVLSFTTIIRRLWMKANTLLEYLFKWYLCLYKLTHMLSVKNPYEKITCVNWLSIKGGPQSNVPFYISFSQHFYSNRPDCSFNVNISLSMLISFFLPNLKWMGLLSDVICHMGHFRMQNQWLRPLHYYSGIFCDLPCLHFFVLGTLKCCNVAHVSVLVKKMYNFPNWFFKIFRTRS